MAAIVLSLLMAACAHSQRHQDQKAKEELLSMTLDDTKGGSIAKSSPRRLSKNSRSLQDQDKDLDYVRDF